jgi:hypothetical protein
MPKLTIHADQAKAELRDAETNELLAVIYPSATGLQVITRNHCTVAVDVGSLAKLVTIEEQKERAAPAAGN